MIVIISSKGDTLNSKVDERFGRATFFIRIETESMAWQAFENTAVSNAHGAGIAAAQFVIDQQAEVVLSGDFGPNAANALSAAGLRMETFKESDLTVEQAVADLVK